MANVEQRNRQPRCRHDLGRMLVRKVGCQNLASVFKIKC